MEINRELPVRMLQETVGISIKAISNDLSTFKGNEHHKIVFQINEEEPDILTIGVLFTLSLMSFTFAAPRGYSVNEFIPDEEWSLGYFMQGLEFENKCLRFSADYISGRQMKTNIVFESGGRVTLTTTNRGRGADRWLTHLQGKKHIQQA